MNKFSFSFTVKAPLVKVADFHKETKALKVLSPPPIFVQLHQIEPLAEGSKADFTLWIGPIPLHWLAVHSNVDALHGFTDTQVRGPLQYWQHNHHFEALDEDHTQVTELVNYEHRPGLVGWLTRILFNPPGLRIIFTYRAWITSRKVER